MSFKGGYQIRIYDNVLGFLPFSLVSKCKTILEEGETVDVTCVQANADLIKLLEKVFYEDQEIDIIVEKLSDKGISLT